MMSGSIFVTTMSSSTRNTNHFQRRGAASADNHHSASPLSEESEETRGKLPGLDREALYRDFTPLVHRLIRQYGQDAEMRQDLAGEIYYRFCALLDAYDPERGVPLRPYLVRQLTAAIYTFARQYWRRDKREVALETETGIRGEQGTAEDPTDLWDANLVQEQVRQALPKALAALPARQRNVVVWRYYEDRSFEEIAEMLGVQTSTARSLLRHGLNNLRKQMGSDHCFGE